MSRYIFKMYVTGQTTRSHAVICLYPETAGLEDHLIQMKTVIGDFKPSRVAIDSLSALERISTGKSFREFVIGLTSFIKHQEVAALFTSTTPSLMGGQSVTDTHISTLTDSIILLRYVEMYGEMRRGLTVLKMRGSMHDKDIREFTFDHTGMHISKPFRNAIGILSGNLLHVPPARWSESRACSRPMVIESIRPLKSSLICATVKIGLKITSKRVVLMYRSMIFIGPKFILAAGLILGMAIAPLSRVALATIVLASSHPWPLLESTPLLWGVLAAEPPNPPALTLSIDDHVPPNAIVESGQSVSYTLSFTNTGGSPAVRITLTVVTPRHTAVTSDTLANWDCRAGVGPTPLCVQHLQILLPTASSQAVFQVAVAADLPEDVDSVFLEASVGAGNVVCGECGYASRETAVRQVNSQGNGLRLYLPVVIVP